MARRDNGTGTIYQRENGTWVGRIYLGKNAEGKPRYKSLSGKTQAEVKRKIKEYNQGGNKTEIKKISVEEYILNWAKLYKKGSIKDSSYDAIEKTIRNQIIPYIGMIQLQQLTSDNIQKLITDLKEKHGYLVHYLYNQLYHLHHLQTFQWLVFQYLRLLQHLCQQVYLTLVQLH